MYFITYYEKISYNISIVVFISITLRIYIKFQKQGNIESNVIITNKLEKQATNPKGLILNRFK